MRSRLFSAEWLGRDIGIFLREGIPEKQIKREGRGSKMLTGKRAKINQVIPDTMAKIPVQFRQSAGDQLGRTGQSGSAALSADSENGNRDVNHEMPGEFTVRLSHGG